MAYGGVRGGKAKAPARGLQRRVKPRFEAEPESDVEVSPEPSDDDAPSEHDRPRGGHEEEDDEMESGEEEEEESGDEPPAKVDISNVSFGALAKAQASLPAVKRRKGRGAQESEEEDSDASEESDNDRRQRGKKARPEKRTSKHAPTEMSSKRPVSRKRDFETVSKPQSRDPRFDPAVASASAPLNHAAAKKAYAFLDDYRATEMAALRAEAKKTKDPVRREVLQRQLMSMENRKKTEDRKERERRILEDHRREEKKLVAQGKTPFYLKKAEQKKRLLTEQFNSMKKKQVDKSIERRRKKLATREKIELEQMERRG